MVFQAGDVQSGLEWTSRSGRAEGMEEGVLLALSNSIPRKIRHVDGPSHLSTAMGRWRVSQVDMSWDRF